MGFARIIILLSTIGVVFGSGFSISQVGPKECAKGIDYWCQDLDSARACGAVHHCIQNVWQYQTLPPDNNEICDLCKKMVTEARDQLESNETQEEIKEVFEGTCRIYFPVKFIANECIKVVDDYIPDFIEELASMMNPQTVCATAGLCNSAKFLKKLGISKIIGDNSVCQECEDTAQNVIKRFQAETDDQFEADMMKICNFVPSISGPCRMAIEAYGKELHETINQAKPNELCMLAGLCDGLPSKRRYKMIMEDGTEVSVKKDLMGTPECDFCKQLVQHLKDMITANSTEEEVKDTLLGICSKLGQFSDTCTNIVKQYFDEIYSFLLNELDPDVVCTAFGLCGTSTVPMVLLVPAQPSGSKFSVEETTSNSIHWAPMQSQASSIKMAPLVQLPETRYMPQAIVPAVAQEKTRSLNSKSSVTCAFCEYAIHELLGILKENRTEEAIKNALDKLCTYMPSTLSEECKDYVNDYSELIISLLEQEVDPSIICQQIGLCSSVHVPLVSMMPSLKLKLPMSKPYLKLGKSADEVSLPGLTPCELCNRVVNLVDTLLEDKPTEQEIIHAVENVCPLMPKSYYSKCLTLLNTYGENIIHYLATLGNGKLVCQAVDICPRPMGQVQLLGGDKCTYGPSYWCKSIIHAKACKAEQHCREKVWIQ